MNYSSPNFARTALNWIANIHRSSSQFTTMQWIFSRGNIREGRRGSSWVFSSIEPSKRLRRGWSAVNRNPSNFCFLPNRSSTPCCEHPEALKQASAHLKPGTVVLQVQPRRKERKNKNGRIKRPRKVLKCRLLFLKNFSGSKIWRNRKSSCWLLGERMWVMEARRTQLTETLIFEPCWFFLKSIYLLGLNTDM